MSDGLVRECARLSAAAYERVAEAEQAEIRRLEAEGYRMVTGGQNDSYGEAGGADWAVQDAHTGELLAARHGTPEDFGAAVEQQEAR